jgi:lysophospholipase
MGSSSILDAPLPAGVRYDVAPLERRRGGSPRLYSYVTTPVKTEAVVAIFHGYADYGARYDHVARAWAARGFATVAVDMRGHGRAEGAPGDCRSFQEYLDDLAEGIALLEARFSGLPRFLFGHSFGALVAVSAVIASAAGWKALVMTSPCLGLTLRVSRARNLVADLASALAPSFGLPSGLKGANLTHDAAVARAYDEDRRVFKNARARWFAELKAAQVRAMASAPSVSLPLYVSMGTEDRVNDLSVAQTFFKSVRSTDKIFDVRPGLFHEVLNEPEWHEIADRMADWMRARAS